MSGCLKPFLSLLKFSHSLHLANAGLPNYRVSWSASQHNYRGNIQKTWKLEEAAGEDLFLIDSDISKITMLILVSISIFFKSVDILTIDASIY